MGSSAGRLSSTDGGDYDVLSACISRHWSFIPPPRRTPFSLDLSFQGRVEEGIVECKRAMRSIRIWESFNDIGAYLSQLGPLREAIPCLERATERARYEPLRFAYQPGPRVFGKESTATHGCFQEALETHRAILAKQALGIVRAW